jgi:ATP-dependent RNA helicase DHX36
LSGQGANANMIVTQPRRISAIGVAERVADERGERVGGTVGYSIKLEKRMSRQTRLLLCTTGVLLRRLQCDPDLASISHVFVDEVRSMHFCFSAFSDCSHDFYPDDFVDFARSMNVI